MGTQEVKTLFVTLRRSLIGAPWFHKRTLGALGLRRRLRCVEKPNNPQIRGMLREVAHMVYIETDQMYVARKCKEVATATLRQPIVVQHSSFAARPALQQQQQQARLGSGGGSSSSSSSSSNARQHQAVAACGT